MPAKRLAGGGVHGRAAREPLPPPDRDIDVSRINLDQPGSAACSLGRDQARASAAKRIEKDPVPIGTIADCIGNEANRLDRGMQRKLVFRAPWNVLARIVPNVRSVPTMLAEPDIVDVGRGPDFEDKNQFVLGSVEGSHPRVGLVPHANVLDLRVYLRGRGEQLRQMSPVDTDKMDGTVE